jgi:phosphoglycolate phosphatase
VNIFFDLDGTLIDSKTRLYLLFSYLNPEIKIGYSEYWNLKKSKISHNEILINMYKYSEEQFSIFSGLWMDCIEKDEWLKYDIPFENTTKTLLHLSHKNNLILVTARQFPGQVKKQLTQFGWSDLFSKILVTEQKTEKYKLIQSLKLPLSENDLIIGDTGKDIQTGKKLGIKTVAVTTGFLNEQSLNSYQPDLIIKNVNELITYEHPLFKF